MAAGGRCWLLRNTVAEFCVVTGWAHLSPGQQGGQAPCCREDGLVSSAVGPLTPSSLLIVGGPVWGHSNMEYGQ